MRSAATRISLLVLIGACCARTPVAEAAWPRDPLANLPISVSAGHDISPSIAPDGSEGVIVAWNDNRNGTDDIYAQRVNGKGAPLWPANGVALCTAAFGQTAAVIASDGAGGAIVSWQDQRNGSNNDIYAQRVSAAGVALWAPNGVVISAAANFQTAPSIIADGAGGAIIAWFDNRTGDDDVYVQRINASGVPQWTPNGVALCTAAGSQNYPKLVSDGAGGAIVLWADWRRWQDSDVFAQRVNAAGAPQWATNGVDMSAASNLYRYDPTLIADGAGGAIAAWVDDRNSTRDVYVQRVNASGVLQWGSGVQIGPTAGWSAKPRMVSDGAGGAIVAWRELPVSEYDIYAGRVSSAGVRQWSINGIPVCTFSGNQESPDIVSDGLGGAIISWQDGRSGSTQRDVYAQRLNSAGVAQWSGNGGNGLPLCSVLGDQVNPVIAADSRGGAVVAWQDFRSASTYDVYAQRIERFGRLGTPEPEISWVRDVPGEQGGRVRLRWSASYLDAFPSLAVGEYGIWRQVPQAFAAAAQERADRRSLRSDGSRGVLGSIQAVSSAGQTTYWEGVGSIPARGDTSYSFVAATFQDSTGASNPYTVFMVDAHAAFEAAFWSSVSDSGYSVDNLPPAPPSSFAGAFTGTAIHLTWGPNAEIDLAGYRLYRGSSDTFVPGPGNFVAAISGTQYDDAGPIDSYYKLSATDIHGNESLFTLATPTTGAASSGVPAELAFGRPAPNPAGTGAIVTFALPAETRVTISVYDASGRLVRRLIESSEAAGRHEVYWDTRDDSGARSASGVYFIKFSPQGGHVLTRRVTLIR